MKKTDQAEINSKAEPRSRPETNPETNPGLKPKPSRGWPLTELVENEHYYMENGFMVFTEEYHLCRGRCCGNACRHCPFEHVNVRR